MNDTRETVIARLTADLGAAYRELAETTEEATHPPEVELGGGSSGYSSWQTAVALRPQVEARIERIKNALARAQAGLYGVCDYCGQPIDPERLEALPWTTHCVQCSASVHPHSLARP